MIRTALIGHPQILCLGELFNPAMDQVGMEHRNEPARQRILRNCTKLTDGFCLHAYPRTMWKEGIERTWEAWDALSQLDARVVVLQRRDLLRVCASVYLAQARDVYHHTVATDLEDAVSLTPLQITTAINDYLQSYEESARLFPDTPVFQYEDLCADWLPNIREIQRHVGVTEVLDLWPQITKSDPRPIEEVISNYERLRDHFRDTEYDKYFLIAESTQQPVVPQKKSQIA